MAADDGVHDVQARQVHEAGMDAHRAGHGLIFRDDVPTRGHGGQHGAAAPPCAPGTTSRCASSIGYGVAFFNCQRTSCSTSAAFAGNCSNVINDTRATLSGTISAARRVDRTPARSSARRSASATTPPFGMLTPVAAGMDAHRAATPRWRSRRPTRPWRPCPTSTTVIRRLASSMATVGRRRREQWTIRDGHASSTPRT